MTAGIVLVRSPGRAQHNLRLTPAVRTKIARICLARCARNTAERSQILFDDNNAHNLDSSTSATLAERSTASAEGSTPESSTPRQPSEVAQHQDDKPAMTATPEDFASALETFTTESEEA